jgi:hypothetical protein
MTPQQQPIQIDPEAVSNVALKNNLWAQVIQGLGLAPHNQVRMVIDEISRQVQEQAGQLPRPRLVPASQPPVPAGDQPA